MKKNKQAFKDWKKKLRLEKSTFLSFGGKKLQILLEETKGSLSLGGLSPKQAKILLLVFSVAFGCYVFLLQESYVRKNAPQAFLVQKADPQKIKKAKLKKELKALVGGYPIEGMIPYLLEKDRVTVAYMIGIAKKESNWGKRKPVLFGQDCYNYWGFRAKWERMGSGGHTCFGNPRQAVDVVSRRLTEIIVENDAESAEDVLSWKCGSNCAVTGGQAAADKWVLDVDWYAEKLLEQ